MSRSRSIIVPVPIAPDDPERAHEIVHVKQLNGADTALFQEYVQPASTELKDGGDTRVFGKMIPYIKQQGYAAYLSITESNLKWDDGSNVFSKLPADRNSQGWDSFWKEFAELSTTDRNLIWQAIVSVNPTLEPENPKN